MYKGEVTEVRGWDINKGQCHRSARITAAAVVEAAPVAAVVAAAAAGEARSGLQDKDDH